MGENVKKEGFFRRIGKSIKGTKSEFKKVVWPTRKQIFNNTLIVIAALIIIGLIIFGLDMLFQFGFMKAIGIGADTVVTQ